MSSASWAQKGDRIALVEKHPTEPDLKRYRLGTVRSVGNNGVKVAMDDPKIRGELWLRSSKFMFVCGEGPDGEVVVSRERPGKPTKVESPRPEKPVDPLAAMKAAGVDLLDVYAALGRELAPRLRQEYLDACSARDDATAKLATAKGMVEKAQEEYRTAEQLAEEAREALDEAEATVERTKARMDSVKE